MRPIVSSRRRCSRWWWGLLSTIVVLSVTGLFIGNEFRAVRSLRQEVASIRAAGHPVDDQSLSHHFFDFTSQDQTAAWREVSVATAHLEQRAVSEYGLYSASDRDLPLSPLTKAAAERLSHQTQMYLKDAEPVIGRIDQLSQAVKPTWQPVTFSAFSTFLPDVQASWQVHRLLSIEFNHAVQTEDSYRALRALQLDAAISEAYDWQLVVVTDMMNMRRQLDRHQRIHAAMALALWNEEHLSSLSDVVGEDRDISRRWRRIFTNMRAMYLTHIDAGSGALVIRVQPAWDFPNQSIVFPASLKLAYLQRWNQVLDVADDGYVGLKHRAHFAAAPVRWPVSYQILRNWVDSPVDLRLDLSLLVGLEEYAALCESFENSRRLTRTAIAVKQYQLRNQRWPDELSDLQALGLLDRGWTGLNGQAFGYRVEPDQSQAMLTAGEGLEYGQSKIPVVTIR